MFKSTESRYNDWVREHYRFLLRSAWVMTGSRAVAEDVAQDTFASAWKHRSQLKNADLARPWLFQIMRRHAFRHNLPATESLDDCQDDLDRQHPLASASHTSDTRLDIVKALSRIAPIHREVLVLFYFDDMSTQHMAEALDIAPGTVLSRLSRARDALRAALSAPAGALRAQAPEAAETQNVVTPMRRP